MNWQSSETINEQLIDIQSSMESINGRVGSGVAFDNAAICNALRDCAFAIMTLANIVKEHEEGALNDDGL